MATVDVDGSSRPADSQVARQSCGDGVGLATRRLRVRFPAAALSSNNLRQVVHTHVPLQVVVV